MPGTGCRFYNCVLCNKRTKPKERRPVNKSIKKYIQKFFFLSVTENNVICQKCRHAYYFQDTRCRQFEDKVTIPSTDEAECSNSCMQSPPSVHLKIRSTSKSHARCFICKKAGPGLIVVPASARISAFIDHFVLIAHGSRCCPSHMNTNTFLEGELNSVKTADCSYLNRTSILELLSSLRKICTSSAGQICFENFKDNDYLNLTGIKKTDFDDLYGYLDGSIRCTPSRTVRTTLGLFLLKLKAGLSNKILATLFSISVSSLRRGIASVRKALMANFVPNHLGFNHITREDIISKHTRPLAQSLFGTSQTGDSSQLILVLDGTYIYVQKSNNFRFQRRSYSMHKGKTLVKPMVIVSTTGYFVTILGPYLADARNSDARILNHAFQTNVEDIKSFVGKDDIFVVDRGFRDSLELLSDLGIRAEMPAFMMKGQKQMSTEDANASRLVTKIRWVVESANARIKRWKFLDKILPTNQIPYIGDYVRIVCAISNKYLVPLSSSDADDSQIAQKMLRQLGQVNELKVYIENNNFERKTAMWRPVDSLSLEQFPRLSEEYLRDLTCGVYQLKLSPSYIQEHLGGTCDVQVHFEDQNLIRVKLQSRHISSKKYVLWLKFDQAEVLAWYCKCRAGARVVGVCSHIAAVVWFLGYARYRYVNPENLGVRDWAMHLSDAGNIPEPIDNSDCESECSESDK